MPSSRFLKASVILSLVVLMTASLANLDSVPPLWWDEGWTLSAARNWVEHGHYGQFLDEQPRSAGLSAAFPVVAPVALSFRWLGIGVWQGRMVGVVFTVLVLALLYFLADRLYQRPVAWGTLVLLLLLYEPDRMNPLYWGRQVLGEIPALFYWLVGVALFWVAMRHSRWLLLLAMLFWGVAFRAKSQIPPFWLASLLLPMAVMLFKRQWRWVGWLAASMAGSLAASWLVLIFQGWLLGSSYIPSEPLEGMYGFTSLVVDPNVRLGALKTFIEVGIPAFFGLGYVSWQVLHNLRSKAPNAVAEITCLMLVGFSGSWLGWYLALGMKWDRYLFPAVAISSIFTSKLLCDLTSQFNGRQSFRRARELYIQKDSNSTGRSDAQRPSFMLNICRKLWCWSIPVAWGWIFLALALNVPDFVLTYLKPPPSIPIQVAEYLDTHTPTDTLIESYETELYFLAQRRFHYPPDQVHVALNYREIFHTQEVIQYDPLLANPDYLVVGPFGKMWKLYEPVLESGAFELLVDFKDYQVYARIR